MAIQVSGTEVISNARNISNVGTVTATSFVGSGASLTGIPTGMTQTLLGTLATTSGTTVTLSSLTLTSYKQLQCIFEGVSGTSGDSGYLKTNGKNVTSLHASGADDYGTGCVFIDLGTGVFWCSAGRYYSGVPNGQSQGGGGQSGLSTASTSISFAIAGYSFDAGSIKIYGVA